MRVKSSGEYVIEVNDNGDTISFDPTDISMRSRLIGSFEKIDALAKTYDQKAAAIDARPDEPLNDFVTRNQRDHAELMDEYYMAARKVLDDFLGEGACQKIFGERNWITMFQDLAEQLEPHLKAMGVNAEKIMAETAKKYAPNLAARRVLE